MKVLVTGAAGFVGRYLLPHLLSLGWEVTATKLPQETLDVPGVSVINLDILKEASVDACVQSCVYDAILHLAAQSSVAFSWEKPELTVDINVKGTLHLLQALRKQNSAAKVLLVGTGEEYGAVRPEEIPIPEETMLRPGNVYAITKAAQNMLGTLYAKAFGLNIVCVRAFNHIGPGQSPLFVVADFCQQIAQIERGARLPVLAVGNLSAKRDFTDVRDVVRAYAMLLEKGKPGETYNVGSGKAVSIQEILDQLLSLTKTAIEVRRDAKKFRPVDVPVIEADTEKLRRDTGWAPVFSLADTLADTLQEWREK